MVLPVEFAREFIESPKRLIPPFDWVAVTKQDKRRPEDQIARPLPDQRFDLVCSAQIAGVVPRGLRFRYSTFPRRLNAACFQLECQRSPNEKTHHILYRMEWHPIRGHTNTFDCSPDIAGRTFVDGETHHHSCLDHVTQDGRIREGDVHAARPIAPDPPDLASAFAFVCGTLNIGNGGDLPMPKDQGRLL